MRLALERKIIALYYKSERFEGLGLSCKVKVSLQAQIATRDNISVLVAFSVPYTDV